MNTAANNLYERDFFAWTEQQAKLIRDKAFNKLDLRHLQEELQLMGASEKRELGSRLTILLMHLLKWKYQPIRQCKSWELTIKVQRSDLEFLLKQNPSLRNYASLSDTFEHSYETAVLKAADETLLDENSFPVKCEWTIEQVLNKEFLPS